LPEPEFDTDRIAETAGADPSAAISIWRYVENDVVRSRRIARDALDRSQPVDPEIVAQGDVVIGAGRVAADADAADPHPALIGAKPAAKHVDAADTAANQSRGSTERKWGGPAEHVAGAIVGYPPRFARAATGAEANGGAAPSQRQT
jgi:hypothetical protein